MTAPHLPRALAACLRRCRQTGVPPTRFILLTAVSRQKVSLIERLQLAGLDGLCASPHPGPLPWGEGRGEGKHCIADAHALAPCYRPINTWRCSTSRFGIGQMEGSNCTPLGLHRIAEKIGGGQPVGTVFKSRRPVGYTWQGHPEATISTRVLWLEGLEPGINRDGDVDSHARYIYIHGTGDETTLGQPASCGCIHLASNCLIPLFDRLPLGTLVWVQD